MTRPTWPAGADSRGASSAGEGLFTQGTSHQPPKGNRSPLILAIGVILPISLVAGIAIGIVIGGHVFTPSAGPVSVITATARIPSDPQPPATATLISAPTGTYEGCPYAEVHHVPDGTTWSPEVGNQPTDLEIWSNKTADQTLYKVWLPNGFHSGDGKRLVFPIGGGYYATFPTGCAQAAHDFFGRDGTPHSATVDQLLNQYGLATEL